MELLQDLEDYYVGAPAPHPLYLHALCRTHTTHTLDPPPSHTTQKKGIGDMGAFAMSCTLLEDLLVTAEIGAGLVAPTDTREVPLSAIRHNFVVLSSHGALYPQIAPYLGRGGVAAAAPRKGGCKRGAHRGKGKGKGKRGGGCEAVAGGDSEAAAVGADALAASPLPGAGSAAEREARRATAPVG